MLISTDWIKDFVGPLDMDAREFGRKVTLSTAEVEEVTEVGSHWGKVRVAEIVSIRKHPEADNLNLVTFKEGADQTSEVVCGAPNVRVGMKVPYAPVGTTFPDGMVLQPKKIRGIVSSGMLCSQKELGLGEDQGGLMELSAKAPLGQDLMTYLEARPDVILNIDNKSLTHRPDLWGHYGMAREVATIFKRELKNPFNQEWKVKLQKQMTQTTAPSPVVPRLEGDSSCLIYLGLSLSGVKVGESPSWMKTRLTRVGLRPINNIVDISNYCMLELGIPLHIFDRDLIEKNQIIIRRVKKEEEEKPFITLDGTERTLTASDTVICDAQGPLVLAGIMGGQRCEVSDSTKNIFIEVANWRPSEVRRTSTRLGLRTDSSQRYEKSLDSALCETTLFRTLELVLQLCPGSKVEGKLEMVGSEAKPKDPLMIQTSYESITKKLGVNVPSAEIKRIFESLAFQVREESGQHSIQIQVPSFRSTKDIEGEADLVEEIGRMVGYDNIPPTSPLGEIKVTRLSPAKQMQRKISDFLVLGGRSLEVTTYPLVGEKLLERARWGIGAGGAGTTPAPTLILKNSLSVDHDRMRPSLIPSLLQLSALNQKNFDQFRFFELGRCYLPKEKEFFQEHSQLGLGFYSKSAPVMMEMVNTVEKLLSLLKLPGELVEDTPPNPAQKNWKNPWIPQDWAGRHPSEYLHIKIMGNYSGAITTVHPLLMRDFKMGGHLTLAILDLTPFEERPPKEKWSYSPLPKFPESVFDCTVVTPTRTPAGDLLKCLRKVKLKELVSSKIVDVFSLSENEKTVTLRFVFQNPEQTLSGEFLKMATDLVVKTLHEGGYPLKTA